VVQGTGLRRSFKFLLRPTAKQRDALTACLEDHRQLYNAALEERREAWRKRRVSVTFYSQSAQLPDIRGADPEGQGRWAAASQQATIRRLDRAFQAFFRRVEASQSSGYPRFKGRGWFDTVVWPQDGNGCRWDSAPANGQMRVYLKGLGHVRVHAHRKVEGRVKTVSVKREGRRWYVVLSCDDVPDEPLPETGAAAGIDMGVASFLTTSDGVQIPNPRHLAASAGRLAVAQQALARCKRESNRRRKVRARVAAIHGKVRRQRLDHARKTALWLVRHHDLIAHEDLTIANMTRSASGTAEAPGTNVAQKRGLNRSILDAGWGVFLRVLASTAERACRQVIAVNPANTSRKCPSCGHRAKENRVTQADFRCVSCGYAGHADVVGAINVLRAGLALQAASAA
jgi:putative transposase